MIDNIFEDSVDDTGDEVIMATTQMHEITKRSTSIVDILCFFLSCVCYAFMRVCLFVPCGHLLGKG